MVKKILCGVFFLLTFYHLYVPRDAQIKQYSSVFIRVSIYTGPRYRLEVMKFN